MNWLTLTVFVVLPLIGGLLAIKGILLQLHGIRVPGTIIDYETRSKSRERGSGYVTSHFPIVRYVDTKGKSHTATMSVSATMRPPESRKPVRMIYPKGKPQDARIDDFWSQWILPIVFCTPAVIYISLMLLPGLKWWLVDR